MKDKIKYIIIGILVMILGFSMFGCTLFGDGNKLATPKNLQINDTTLTWDVVENAIAYKVNIDGTEYDAMTNKYSLSALTEKKTYKLKVKALGNGEEGHKDSNWSSVKNYAVGEVAEELKFELINNDTAYRVSKGTITSFDIVIPATYSGKPVTEIGSFGGIIMITPGFDSNAFYIRKITIPNSITSIIAGAFINCNGMTMIMQGTTPPAITSDTFRATNSQIIIVPAAGLSAYKNAWNAYSNKIYSEANVVNGEFLIADTSISTNALIRYFGNADKVTIPNGVKITGDNAFDKNRDLSAVTIPDSMIYFGYASFSDCINLKSITIPDTVMVGDYAFSGSGLISITLPKSTIIGNGVFNNCKNLTSVIMPTGVKSIGNSAFAYCTGLKSITIPDGVESLGNNVFSGCTGFTSIVIPNSVTYIGKSAFAYCSELQSITIGNNVTYIGERAFEKCLSLKSITLPDSVTRIESYIFSDCSGLQNITIGNNVTYIGERAFENCSGLKSITIPDKVTKIESYAFSNCSELRNIKIGKGVKSVSWSSIFYNCSEIDSITVESGNADYKSENDCLIQISDNALIFGCKNSIIPNYITGIAVFAFRNCTGLTNITIPDSVSNIDQNAFDNTGIWNSAADGIIYVDKWVIGVKREKVDISGAIALNADTVGIAVAAFYSCSKITDITIPNSVKYIGQSAFSGTGIWNSAADGIVYIDKWVIGVKGSTANISGGIALNIDTVGIADAAFQYCSNLTSITLPESVTIIGNNAFSSCSNLISITIPKNIISIGINIFGYCRSLKDIYFTGTMAQWNAISKIIVQMPTGVTVHCKDGDIK